MGYKLYLYLFTLWCTVMTCNSTKVKILNKSNTYHPFNQKLYKEILNKELCQRQLDYLKNNDALLLATFLDAGVRLPKGVLTGNNMDMGNYYQCLGIQEEVEGVNIQGKYCAIDASLRNEVTESQHPPLEWPNSQHKRYIYNETYKKKINHKLETESAIERMQFTLGLCIPAPCTTEDVVNSLLFNITNNYINYEEEFCRLPNDKIWAPVDYVATAIFSIIGILTILCTGLNIYYRKIAKKDPSNLNINPLYFCFCVMTNSRRLLTFTSSPDSLNCIDGIRALAMVWVILGHTFHSLPFIKNRIEAFEWSISPEAIWMTSGHMTVDTFFMLSGLLIVYTAAGKLSGRQLLKNLHKFYLNRLLRMFPVLAFAVLFEASFFNRLSDGPFWIGAASNVVRCREYWWSTLLHIQNYVNPRDLCVGVTWYLSVDVQLHIFSPIVLFWVLSTKKSAAWSALIAALLAVLTSSTIYIFMNNFPSGIISPGRVDDMDEYFVYFYVNTLTRASPFFVGMIFGYILHLCRGKEVSLTKIMVAFCWCATFALLGLQLYVMYCNIQPDWNNQIADNLINSFMRSLWALCLGWIIFGCSKGYGGPINWFLSLQIWKLPARVSYAMYIIHYSIMISYYYSAVDPVYFSVPAMIFNFFTFFSFVFALAFVITVVFDSPFSTIFKVILGAGSKRSKKEVETETNTENITQVYVKTGLPNPAFTA